MVLFSYVDSPLQESMNALLKMRITSKEKETEALLAGEQDPCSCYIEVRLIFTSCYSASKFPTFFETCVSA